MCTLLLPNAIPLTVFLHTLPRAKGKCRYKLFHTDLDFHTVCLDWLNFCFLGAKFNLSYECGGSSVQISIFLMNVVAHLCKFCSAKFNLSYKNVMGNGKLLICSLPMAGTDSLFSASWIIFRFCSSIFLLNVRVPPPGIDMTFVHTKSLSRPFSRGAAKRPLEKALTVAFTRSPTRPLVHYWPGLTLDNLRAFAAIGSARHFLPPGLLCFALHPTTLLHYVQQH